MSLRRAAKRSKYGAIPTVVDGIRFASRKEANRYAELKLLERGGLVKELELQPKFPLYVMGGRKQVQVATYIGDFRYRFGPQGILVVEDVKGMKTPVYRLKKRMVETQYGIEITEV
jgi:hypothetical protein